MVPEFDMDALAAIGLVKFDFLGLRNLDTLQKCVDLIKANTGTDIDLYQWNEEYHDADVWKFISDGNTLGCFQIETPGMTKMTKAVQPKNLPDMADVTTLDRPGPLRSGLDKQYLNRRFGREAVQLRRSPLGDGAAPYLWCHALPGRHHGDLSSARRVR